MLDSSINFVRDRTEWKGTDIVFEIAKKFYWFSNLSHNSKLSEDEAILGYNAGVSVIHHIISVYSKTRKSE